MKVLVHRVGAGFQTDLDSKVGGGRIARQVVRDLLMHDHEVSVVGRTSDASTQWLRSLGAHCGMDTRRDGADLLLLLTGPFNPMYDALVDTYKLVAGFEGQVVYAQWDAALPFHFAPERVPLFASKSSVTMAQLLANKTWRVLTQLRELAPKAPASTARGEFPVQLVPCFWELAEVAQGTQLAPCSDPIPAFGYFGSPRPGRLSELKRWFGKADSPPLALYGKWSDKQLAQVAGPNTKFMGPVAETTVRDLLNRHAATLHSADTAYVKTDFVAQRFIENAMAGVPVAYSDRIQPTVAGVVPARWVMRDPGELAFWWNRLQDKERRIGLALDHAAHVLSWARAHPHNPATVLALL